MNGTSFEVWRRVLFLLLIAGGFIAYTFTDVSPLFKVRPLKDEIAQNINKNNKVKKNEDVDGSSSVPKPLDKSLLSDEGYSIVPKKGDSLVPGKGDSLVLEKGDSLTSEKGDLLTDNPDGISLDEKMDEPLIPVDKQKNGINGKNGEIKIHEVEGGNWESFFANINQSFQNKKPQLGWENRITPMETRYGSLYSLYFKTKEQPLSSLDGKLKEGETLIIKLKDKKVPLLEIFMSKPSINGFSGPMTSYPTEFIYPYRQHFHWFWIGAIVIYIILPWPKKGSNILIMKKSKLILGDFVAFLLFFMFFAIPFFIIGSFQEAVTTYIAFTAVFWGISLLGLVLVHWSIKYAKLMVTVRESGITINAYCNTQEILFSDMLSIQKAIIKSPRWLILSTLTADIARPGIQAQGIMSLLNSNGGLCINLKDGKKRFLWYSDSFGNFLLQNFEVLATALENAKVPLNEEVIQIRAVFPPE